MKTQRGRETEGGGEKESQRERGRIVCAREKIDTGRKDLVKEIKREYVCVHQCVRAPKCASRRVREIERERACVCMWRERGSVDREEREITRTHMHARVCVCAGDLVVIASRASPNAVTGPLAFKPVPRVSLPIRPACI